MDRRCAGALLALAACIASTAAAPTASNQTALDLYDGAQQGCYYNFQHYGEGDRIMTNEPCLNCTCHNRMLMCYLRVCPFTKPIGQDCAVEKRADQCCPIVTCPDVPVDLLTSTSTTSPAEYGETGLGKLDRYGCSINGKYFPEGAKVPPTPSKPCEHCYCIRNMTTCVMQECTLHVDGCTPIYHKDVCCPVRYSCDHPEGEIPLLDDMTTTVRPTPGFLLTTTTVSPVTQMTQDCVHDDDVFADGALIRTEKACEHCYCMKGDIVCVVQECGTPMENEGKNCTSMPPREGQCCPDTYICEGDELTTETKPDFTTESSSDEITTSSPPRRVVVEGSGYRKEPGEPFTEEPTFESDTEGSGEDEPFKPIDESEVEISDSETTRPLITTENDDNIDQYTPSTPRIPIVDSEMIDKATTEPDKGENTVPSGGLDEDEPEMSISDKTTPVESKLATESGVTTESYFDAKTTATHDDQSSITDTITTEADIAPTKAAPASETTTADYQSPTLSDNKATAEPAEVSESTPDKQENEKTPSEITTPEDKEDALTTKATDFAVDAQTTESATSFVDQEGKTTTAQHLPEQENEVIVKEPTTESYPESSTKSDIIKMETEPAATITTDVTTPGKEHTLETTSINPIDNEIDEESYPTSSPGRIPGEGDCLLDGITYSNETIVPSNNNCHTSCRCISSIVKCDPIICSAPPDYMDNCQPMYDPPEACCPTYVCDHTKETVPPQSHSQMAGTESPIPTPSVECNGDQCEISKDKEDTIEPTDSSKKPDECGPEGCQGTDKKPDHESHPSTEECVGEKCTSPQAHCANGKCESPITPDQICDSENGCKTPEGQECQGENCKTQPEIIPAKDSSAPCNSADGCEDSQATPPQVHCADGKCESPPTTNQICDSENGCKIPEGQACQGEDCKTQPEVIPAKDSSTQCNSADGCENGQVPPPQVHCADGKCQSPPTTNQICDTEKGCQIPVEQACQGEDCKAQPEVIPEKDSSASCNNADDCKESQVPEEVPNCQGESCTSGTDTKDAEDCKDGSDCVRHEQSPTMEECKEEGCRRKDVPDISKPATGECTDSNCLSLENIPQVTNAPETITEAIPKITELSGSNENIPDEAVTEQKEPDIEKEIEPKITTEASIFAKDDEIQSTTQYDETEKEKEEFMPSITETPEIKTQAPEVQQYTTEITMQKETTVTPLEITSAPSEESSTNAPKLSDSSTDDRFADLPIVVATEQPLVDDHQTKIPQEDIINDQQKNDLTTSIPTIHDVAADISEDTTAHTERNYPDVDTNTKVPEYVQEQDETQTDSSTTVSSLDGVVPDNVHKDSETNITERDESNTSVTEETSTKKLDEEPIEHEPHETVTTPKSYDGEINFPDNPDTEAPIHDGSEEDLDTHTATPDQLSTLSQEQQHEKEETVQPGSMVTSDEPITSRPDDMVTESMIAPGDESETKSPILPEVSPSEDDNTRVPESTETIPEDELYTKTPIHDTTDEIVVTPSEIVDKNKIPTEAPMSIIKDKEEDGTKPTQASEISVPVTVQELTTQRSASSETSPTESYGSVTEPKEPEMGENVKDSEKESSPGAEEPVAVTEKATSIDESSSEQPNKETKVPEISASDASTDKSPVTVSIVEQPEHPEPSVTEAGAVEPAATGEETSDIEPVTSIPTESIDTKSPESYTEIPKQTISEDMDITPTKDQSAEKEDSVTDIPELTIHEHTESILTTEKSEQFDVTADVATKAPDMLATEPQVISTQKEAEGVPDLQESITNAPDVSATESPKEATEAPEQELLTPGHPLTEPSEYEPKDFTTAIPETPVTEIQKENTGVPEVHHVPTETPEIHVVDPDKEITEGSVPQDITTSDSRISVTEPTKEVSETPEIQDSVTGLPASQTTIMADVSEEEPHKESTAAPDLLDIATSGPEISKPDSDKESSESPSSQDATTKVPEISDAAVTEAQQEASGEPEPQEIATIAPETATQKDVTEIPESQDITTSAPKISVSDTQEEASEAPESQEAATKIPEMLTTGAQKDATEMSDVADTHIPEISVTESQKEGTKASVAPDVATDIPESPATESPSEVTPAPVTHDTATNIPEATSSKTKQDMTEAPVVQDVATEFPETSATESQKEVTDNSVPQDVATNIPEIPATESQKEVTEAPQTQDHDTSITESPATDSPKEATESPAIPDLSTDIPETPVTDSQKEVTKTPVDQNMVTNVPESLATESQKEVTEAPITQDVITGIPEIPVDEFEKEATEAPVAQDAATSTPETPSVETKKDMTQAPVIEDITTVIPETSATKSQSEATEAPLAQDVATSIPEIPATESQKEVTEPEVAQDVTTNISEISVTESQNAATEAPEAQDIATKKPEIPTIETQKEVTEAPMTQDIATNIPEISATESEKETTETPVAQNVATNITDTSATQSQKDVTEVPDTQDAVTSVPEIIVTEPKKEVTESPMSQDVATSIEETSATESQKEVTEAPLVQDITTMIPETSAPESQKKVTGTPIAQDVATSISETPATESQKEITESPVSQDTATRIPETSATESQKEVTESSVSQDAATSIPETAATESQKEVTEAPEAQNIATDLPAVSATESQMELTELPVSQDVATSVPETSATESQKEVTEAPGAQNVATDIPAISATESQKELTESPVSEGAATSIPETSATESQKEVTEAPGAQNAATELPAISATESQQELTESPVSEDAATSIPDTPATESQKEVTETPVAQDVATDIPATSATESQKEVTEAPADLDVVEDGVTKSQESHVIATDEPEIAVTDSPKYDTTMSSEAELINEQSTKVPESLVTEYQDKITDMNIVTVKPTTSLQDSDDEKPKDEEKVNTEMPILDSGKPDEHMKPEKSDASTESTTSSESVQPDIKSPEEDNVSKSPDPSEVTDQDTKTSEEPTQTSESPETTPYLVLLEEHTHKKDIYTESPDDGLSTGAPEVPSDNEPTTEISVGDVTESAPITDAAVPPKQETVPTEKDESAHVTDETVSEKVTEPSLISEEITTITPLHVTEEVHLTEKPQDLETNEISTAAPGEEQKETDKPSTNVQDETDKLVPSATEKPIETTAPEEEFILATTKATTIKTEDDLTSPSLVDKYGKPDEAPKPGSEPETQKPDITEELPKPGINEVQTTEEAPQPDFPPSGTSSYGQEPDYGEEDQAFGPGTCRYGGKVYVSAQQIPRDDPCDFCFCFRSDIICLQQSCPPPIHGCHEEPIQGFCCPRYECPVSMATTLNVTTTTTTTTTTLPPHFLPHAYKGAAQRRGCQIKGHTYKVGEVVRASSGPCLHCTCGGDGQMKCDPKVCTPEPMLRQMIAAAVSAKRRR